MQRLAVAALSRALFKAAHSSNQWAPAAAVAAQEVRPLAVLNHFRKLLLLRCSQRCTAAVNYFGNASDVGSRALWFIPGRTGVILQTRKFAEIVKGVQQLALLAGQEQCIYAEVILWFDVRRNVRTGAVWPSGCQHTSFVPRPAGYLQRQGHFTSIQPAQKKHSHKLCSMGRGPTHRNNRSWRP